MTLESPLDCKEIKHVNPKGNQLWIFNGRTDAEAPILWPPDAKSWLIGKEPYAGKDWEQEKKRVTGWNGWIVSVTKWIWVWASSGRWWWTEKPGMLQSMGLQRVRHDWVIEQQVHIYHILFIKKWGNMLILSTLKGRIIPRREYQEVRLTECPCTKVMCAVWKNLELGG